MSSFTSKTLTVSTIRETRSISYYHTFVNPNPYGVAFGGDDDYGDSIDIDGNYCIVGAKSESNSVGSGAVGSAYIYDLATKTLLHTLANPTDTAIEYFGTDVAISGNYAAVSAYGYPNGGFSGRVYVFNVTTGGLVHTLNNPNPYSTTSQDRFGNQIAMSGNYLIVGAYQEDDAGGAESGKSYIYNVTTGGLLFTLNNPNPYSTSAADYFGDKIAMSGNYAIIGTEYEDDAGGTSSGKAYIYNVTTGALVHTLNNPNAYGTSAGDVFGRSVDIFGNYAIVGADNEDDGNSSSGKAYIFNVTTGALVYTLDNPNAYGTTATDVFGSKVAINDHYAFVAASGEDAAGKTNVGRVYIFDLTTGGLVRTLDPITPSDFTAIAATALSVSSNYLMMDFSPKTVYVYKTF